MTKVKYFSVLYLSNSIGTFLCYFKQINVADGVWKSEMCDLGTMFTFSIGPMLRSGVVEYF